MSHDSQKPEKRTIQVKYLARVEGEGALDVTLEGNRVKDLQLRIFEPPRFFEALLRGRKLEEAPDITSRICGICPVAYQTSAVNAMEGALAFSPHPTTQLLRRLLYCGEWIESHTLHIYLLHAPDFLGYEGAIEMAKKFPKRVEDGLFLKKIGNHLITRVGGREIHPINVRVGGFYRYPRREELLELIPNLQKAKAIAEETVRWVASFPFPDYNKDYTFVSLKSLNHKYPIENGVIVTSTGLEFPAEEFEANIEEFQVPHSTSLHAKLHGKNFLVGPLARMHHNFSTLKDSTKDIARSVGFSVPIKNPFRSIVARALEVYEACDEALELIESYHPPDLPLAQYSVQPGIGYGVSEAPRGLLYHRYEIDEAGLIAHARITPPTSQNLMTIEEDLKSFIESHVHLPKTELDWRSEQLLRNYDPCISCSAHFLTVKWNHKNNAGIHSDNIAQNEEPRIP